MQMIPQNGICTGLEQEDVCSDKSQVCKSVSKYISGFKGSGGIGGGGIYGHDCYYKDPVSGDPYGAVSMCIDKDIDGCYDAGNPKDDGGGGCDGEGYPVCPS